MTSQTTQHASLDELRSSIGGRIVIHEDDDYGAMRQVFVGDVDGRPAAIIRVVNAGNVARIVDFHLNQNTPPAGRAR